MSEEKKSKAIVGRILLICAGIATMFSPAFLPSNADNLAELGDLATEYRWLNGAFSLSMLWIGAVFVISGLRANYANPTLALLAVIPIFHFFTAAEDGIYSPIILIPAASGVLAILGVSLLVSSKGKFRQWFAGKYY